MSKATQQISWHPAQQVKKPLEWVHLDLIQMTEAYNRDKWVLYFLDDHSQMNYIYMIQQKI